MICISCNFYYIKDAKYNIKVFTVAMFLISKLSKTNPYKVCNNTYDLPLFAFLEKILPIYDR
jgi:hypothetical protein